LRAYSLFVVTHPSSVRALPPQAAESGSEPPPERSGGRTSGWLFRFTGF